MSKIRDIDVVDEPHYTGAKIYNEKNQENHNPQSEEPLLTTLRTEIPSSHSVGSEKK